VTAAEIEPRGNLSVPEGAADEELHSSGSIDWRGPELELPDSRSVYGVDHQVRQCIAHTGEVQVGGETTCVPCTELPNCCAALERESQSKKPCSDR